MSYGNGPYIPRERFEDEDAAYDDERQRKLDDELEAKAKRAASGISKEELSLQDAFAAGQRAGHMSQGASMNPYDHGSQEHVEWERARMAALSVRLASSR